MVQRNWQELSFVGLCLLSPHKAEKVTAGLPERFPAVGTVKLQLSTTSSYLVVQVLMPMLARCVCMLC